MWGSRSEISAANPRIMFSLYSVMKSKLGLLTRGIFVIGDFSEILMCCSISLIYMDYSYPFCTISLSSCFLSSFGVLDSIVSSETSTTFLGGSR